MWVSRDMLNQVCFTLHHRKVYSWTKSSRALSSSTHLFSLSNVFLFLLPFGRPRPLFGGTPLVVGVLVMVTLRTLGFPSGGAASGTAIVTDLLGAALAFAFGLPNLAALAMAFVFNSVFLLFVSGAGLIGSRVSHSTSEGGCCCFGGLPLRFGWGLPFSS